MVRQSYILGLINLPHAPLADLGGDFVMCGCFSYHGTGTFCFSFSNQFMTMIFGLEASDADEPSIDSFIISEAPPTGIGVFLRRRVTYRHQG
jgi:hypothetical protein